MTNLTPLELLIAQRYHSGGIPAVARLVEEREKAAREPVAAVEEVAKVIASAEGYDWDTMYETNEEARADRYDRGSVAREDFRESARAVLEAFGGAA